MKKIVISFLLILVISAICFIPIAQQKTVIIKSPFLRVYSQLVKADGWENWRPDLRKVLLTDSDKIAIKKDSGSFSINCLDLKLNASIAGNSIYVNEQNNDKTNIYNYIILPGKGLNKTAVTVSKKVTFINYLIRKIKPVSFSDTHIDDLKKFMETDSLYYGCNIFKTKVPEENLIVIRKVVFAKNKFTEAAKMLETLRQYIKTNNVKKMQPLIAQFISKGKDSTQITVGFFINKEVSSDNSITFMRMPKNGPWYSAKFYGQFRRRQKIYIGIQQYFTNHLYQLAILPFETYLDDKLPISDTDEVKMQINFATYF